MILRPMKGAAIQVDDLDRLTYPKYASPKLDGFRCVLGEHPFTSRMSRFPNEHFHKTMSGIMSNSMMLDSEVVVGKRRGKGVLQRTSSGLTSVSGEPDFTLWVFDIAGLVNHGWLDRHGIAGLTIQAQGNPHLRLLKHRLIRDAVEANDYLVECLELEFEGIMVRGISNPYKEGKSTFREQGLLKLKPFADFEARITGWFEEEENTNAAKKDATGKSKRSSAKVGKVGKGTLGGFTGTELKTGKPVRVGGGFTAAQRKAYWLIRDELVAAGAIMECAKQLMGEKDVPRHPTFKRIRPGWDITDY